MSMPKRSGSESTIRPKFTIIFVDRNQVSSNGSKHMYTTKLNYTR